VQPGAEQFIYPTRKYASMVISGEAPLEQSAAEVLKALKRAKAATNGR
jgi:uridine kinase